MLKVSDAKRKYWVLAAMGAVLGIVLLDETVVGVALPTMTRDLGLSVVGSHWVVNAYLLVFAVLAAAAGRLGDIVGLKTLFVIGLAIFGLASLASGFAQSGAWLIATRAVQGVGSAIIFPASLAIISHAFPPEQRGMAIGVYGAVGTFFLSLGPFAGGFFSEFLSWRWIFWINPPIVIVIALVMLGLWRDPPRDQAEKIDIPGLLALVVGLGMIVFAVMQGPDWGWSHLAVWLVLAIGVIVTAGFVLLERRLSHPLIDVDLFRNSAFTSFNTIIFLAQFTKIAMFIFVAAYLQDVLGYTAMIAGVALLATTVPTLLAAFPAGVAVDRIGSRVILLAGLATCAIVMTWISVAVTFDSYLLLLPSLIVAGACNPVLFAPSLRDVMNSVTPDKRGQAGGISMTAQLLGGTVGMTVCGTLFAVTDVYWPIFAMIAVFYLITLLLCWRTLPRFEKPQSAEVS